MKSDVVVFSLCSFALGLIIGSLLIGPHLRSTAPAPAPAVEAPAGSAGPAAGPGANPMGAVRAQLATLQKRIEQDPRDAEALGQLGEMYMEAAKFSQAIGYLERALAIREDANVRSDLGFCYRQSKEPAKALAAFQQASRDAPDQWQPLFNEAYVLGELHRVDEERALVARLRQMGADPEAVKRLERQLGE